MPFGFRFTPVAAAAALVTPVLFTQNAFAQELKVGSPAPKIAVSQWVKGQPVKIEKGKVYVVEFWATWCGPCKTSIPHLTDLAKKYKDKVTFVGVSVWERGDNIPGMVNKFVTDMGDKMAYNVALDETTGTMAKTWMEAAQQDGIPSAFVIGKDGNVAWIGHPMSDLDTVLEQVNAGTFDPKALAEKKAKEEEEMKAVQEIAQKAGQLAQSGKFAEAVTELDKIKSENPAVQKGVAQMKFQMLTNSDVPAANKFAKEAGNTVFKDDATGLNFLAWTLVDPAQPVKGADFDLALMLAEKAVALTKEKDAMILDTLATAHYQKGNLDKAISYQEKAVALLNADKEADPEAKKEIMGRLAMFKAKKAAK
jgi:thiol-disulfide isomerase/thioredoxin